MKNNKNELQADSVISNTFHVGIELELVMPGASESEHDDERCEENYRDYINDMSDSHILTEEMGLSVGAARQVSPHFDFDSWRSDAIDNHRCDGDCGCETESEFDRDSFSDGLVRVTGNKSFKVVSDGSVEHASDESDAEVCWNYFASKETIKDNSKIMGFLKLNGAKFNRSCGLHINLNDYLKLERHKIPTSKLDFLFNTVASSRRASSYCSRFAVAGEKYSMLHHQDDRVEFRFFSPTLDAVKLNHYVTLANVVYRRLCGKDTKLPKKTEKYLFEKMVNVNGLPEFTARMTIEAINSIADIKTLAESKKVNELEETFEHV